MTGSAWMTDKKLEQMISVLLRTGVLLSGMIVLAGGVYFVYRHGYETLNVSSFRGEPSTDRQLREMIHGVLVLRARSIIQFGICLLIATPIVRVVFALAGFALERDRAYVWITALVLLILVYSLVSGTAGG